MGAANVTHPNGNLLQNGDAPMMRYRLAIQDPLADRTGAILARKLVQVHGVNS